MTSPIEIYDEFMGRQGCIKTFQETGYTTAIQAQNAGALNLGLWGTCLRIDSSVLAGIDWEKYSVGSQFNANLQIQVTATNLSAGNQTPSLFIQVVNDSLLEINGPNSALLLKTILDVPEVMNVRATKPIEFTHHPMMGGSFFGKIGSFFKNAYNKVLKPVGKFVYRKITKTSFLDAAFRKNLESSLRFGNPLLVQDAESYDALLNPVLNREVRRTGGRVLITIGDQDIDLSPAFRVLLTTRNPSVEFSPDLCSRVTIVNFTVTPSSLQTQCLNKVLRCERPDVDAKRSDLLKLQGEFRLRLHQLESELLSTLNESKGSILDDNRVISQLETLKAEATEITRKAAETDQVIAEIDAVSQQYNPLAVCCTSIFFTLEQMQSVHFLYHYSLQFFLDIFNFVLTQNPNLKNVKEPHARLSIITVDLFHTIFARVAPGLLHDDRMPLALIFSNFKAHGTPEQFPEAEFSYFLKGSSAIVSALPDGYRRLVPNLVSEEQARAFLALSQAVPAFKDVLSDLQDNQDAVKEFIAAACPEENIPPFSALNDDKASHTAKYLRELLILQILRGDRVLTKAHTLVDEVLGKELLQKAELASDLETVVEHEIKPNTPILLCGVSGYDPSTHVNDLATATNKQCTNIAIGSAEVCRGSFLNFTSLILSFRASLLLTTPFLALPNLVDGCC